MYYKNQIIELKIIDMTKEGLGLSKIDGRVFFVKNAILGDTVRAIITKVTSGIIYSKALKILLKSEYRVKAKCDVCESCGGCQLLNLDYNKQIEIKSQNVINTISKIGKFDRNEIVSLYDGIVKMERPCHFRNKMQVPFSKRNGEVIFGFYAGRTHHIIEFDNCIIGFSHAELILNTIKKAIVKFDISVYEEESQIGVFREVLLRCGSSTKEISITYILNDKKYEKNLEKYRKFDEYIITESNKLLSDFKDEIEPYKIVTSTININTNNNNVLFGNTNITLSGKSYIEDNINEIKYHISPESFYQVNMIMTNVLYDKIIEYGNFSPNNNVLDLYCGIGTISLYVANRVNSVIGIEIVKKAVDNAIDNAKLNNIDNAKFKCLDIENINDNNLKDILNFKIDTIIVDPPRKGLDQNAINLINGLNPKKIIYISCDVATLSRDLDILCHKYDNYKLTKLSNVDMFPHTMHIETVSLLENINSGF